MGVFFFPPECFHISALGKLKTLPKWPASEASSGSGTLISVHQYLLTAVILSKEYMNTEKNWEKNKKHS